MIQIKQGSLTPIPFFMVDVTDHIQGKTTAAPVVTISKAGAAFAAPAGTVAELTNGWYKLTPTAADTGTEGPLAIRATGTGADPRDFVIDIVARKASDVVADVWADASAYRTVPGSMAFGAYEMTGTAPDQTGVPVGKFKLPANSYTENDTALVNSLLLIRTASEFRAMTITAFAAATEYATLSDAAYLATTGDPFHIVPGEPAAGSTLTTTSIRQEIDANSTRLTTAETNANTLLARMSALRTGYLDNLSAGPVAQQADMTTLLANVTAPVALATDMAMLLTRVTAAVATATDMATLLSRVTAVVASATDMAMVLGRLTAPRATLLDNLNAQITSRSTVTMAEVLAQVTAALTAAVGNQILSAAQTRTEAAGALVDVNLDHLVGTPTAIPVLPAGTFLAQTRQKTTASAYDPNVHSLEAVANIGGTSGAPSTSQIVAAIDSQSTVLASVKGQTDRLQTELTTPRIARLDFLDKAITAIAVTATVDTAAVADKVLGRNVKGGADGGALTVAEALMTASAANDTIGQTQRTSKFPDGTEAASSVLGRDVKGNITSLTLVP